MTRRRSPKTGAYAALTAAALLAALVLRRPELAALAAPFALCLALGLAAAEEVELAVEVTLDRARATEGDQVELAVRLRAATALARVELRPLVPDGLRAAPGELPTVLALAAGEERRVPWRLACAHWGGYLLGQVRVRAGDRFGLLVHRRDVHAELPLKVYPRPEPLRSLVRPLRTQRLVGEQVARRSGDGVEFADIRALVPGDQVRRINWRASARRGELYVNDHHPERNADVVLFLDTFAEARDERAGPDGGRGPDGRRGPDGQPGTLDLTVRAAASLAAHYLASKDRVGLIGFGGVVRWLHPAGGRTQDYRIVDTLIDSQIAETWVDRSLAAIPARMLPPNGLVLGLTPLLDERGIAALLDLRARGFEVAILVLSPVPFTRPGRREDQELAWRLWSLQREQVQASYRRLGVAVAEWRADRPLEAVLKEVRTFRRMAARGRG